MVRGYAPSAGYLSLNRRAKVKAWIGDKKSDLQSKAISIFDKSLLDRLWR